VLAAGGMKYDDCTGASGVADVGSICEIRDRATHHPIRYPIYTPIYHSHTNLSFNYFPLFTVITLRKL